MDTAGKTEILFNEQVRDWELAGVNYSMLGKVETRVFGFGGYEVFAQFNPGRIRSSAAKVDARSVEERPCFLCAANRPHQQRGVTTASGLTILVNPFPIFDRHLTIVSEKHTPQLIGPNFALMLELASELGDYLVFYNGPQCGASAPDHFHFQAGNRGFLPLEKDFSAGRSVNRLTVWAGTEIWLWNGYGRGIATLKGNDAGSVATVFSSFYGKLSRMQPGLQEPMMNILAYREGGEYVVHLIPRRQHRPSQFFSEDSDKLLISPASVDLGGVVITPREEDFRKLTAELLADIFDQVCLGDGQVLKLFEDFLP